jgi:hypothetical protein
VIKVLLSTVAKRAIWQPSRKAKMESNIAIQMQSSLGILLGKMEM